jgi:ubiquinol-cytochrome c reductase cytochrome c1 subunit
MRMPKAAISKIAGVTLGSLLSAAAFAASSDFPLEQSGIDISNRASLQRGAQVFFNYCASCHSAQYMRYSRLMEDLELTEDQVQQNLNFLRDPTDPTQPRKIGELVQVSMSAAQGERWFGKAPPDLTLTARYKHGGADWLYTFLKSYYLDPTRPNGWNNALFANTSMPNPLWEYQGIQAPKFKTEKDKDGVEHSTVTGFEAVSAGKLSATEYDGMVRDLSAFMEYLAEPAALQRERYGVWVLLYLLLLCGVAYLLKSEYWKDVH